MSYKTILVQADKSPQVGQCIGVASRITNAENAHLIGAAMNGVSRFLYQAQHTTSDAVLALHMEELRQKAASALDDFEKQVTQLGVKSYERRLVEDDAAGGLSLQGRYADLVVLPQYDPDAPPTVTDPELAAYVAMNSGSPVLLIPHAGSFDRIGTRGLIAWNASVEAIRSVRAALPLLKRAQIVDVVLFNPESRPDAFGAEPGADLALYLARHDVRVNVIRKTTDEDTGNALLSVAAEQNADLIVMGCYGHSRFREILLGGVTRVILQKSPVPVLMAH